MSDEIDNDGQDAVDAGYQVKEGAKSFVRVAVATAINPVLGGAALLFEVGRSAAIALGGKEAGDAVGTAINVANGGVDKDDLFEKSDD